jgi:hypothetical protein
MTYIQTPNNSSFVNSVTQQNITVNVTDGYGNMGNGIVTMN